MDKSSVKMLVARLVQMLFALIAMGFAIALSNANWYYSDSFLKVAPALSSVCVAVGGTFGLFALHKQPDSTHDARLFLLVLYIDVWAAILSIIAGATYWANGNEYYDDPNGMLVAGAVLSHFNTLVIAYPIFRTLRLWWKRILYTVPQEAYPESQTIYIQQPQPQYVQPVYIVNDPKSNPQPRPLSEAQASTISAATLAYRPSIMETTQGTPTRAPSYTTYADAGARMEKH